MTAATVPPVSPATTPARAIPYTSATAVAIVLVLLWRRFLLRRPWSGVALPWARSALPQALLGMVVAVAAVQVATAGSVAAGATRWESWSVYGGDLGTILLTVVVILSVSVLLQGFPEELVWRGHLHDLLSTSLSPRLVLVLTGTMVLAGVLLLSLPGRRRSPPGPTDPAGTGRRGTPYRHGIHGSPR